MQLVGTEFDLLHVVVKDQLEPAAKELEGPLMAADQAGEIIERMKATNSMPEKLSTTAKTSTGTWVASAWGWHPQQGQSA